MAAEIPEYALQAPISKRCAVTGCKGTAKIKGLCVRHDRWARRHPGQPLGPIGKKGRPPKGASPLVRLPGLHLEPWAVEEARRAAAAAKVSVGELLRRWVHAAAGNARSAREAAGNPGKGPPSALAGELGPQTAPTPKDGLGGS